MLAHVVCHRRTLPWERLIDTPRSASVYPGTPWLAVLVCDEATAPELKQVTAKDLVPAGAPITVVESAITGTGTLAATTLSYGTALLRQLGYGETPDDPCTVIDLPVATFSHIAPAAADLEYLAHIREVDTTVGASPSEQHAVVIANRVPATQGVTRAFLVSLEGMADYLPGPDGTPSGVIGPSIDTVRLCAYRSWTFTVNDLDETLERLLQGLNAATLMVPITGTAPSAPAVAQALAHQAAGTVSSDDARILMQNALLMGYVPLDHHLRHGGRTVSFYRGPFVPLPVPATTAYYSGPDAANAYDAQTGLFDVSYGAAWQLGQLLALQSSGMANQLYQWKRAVTLQQAVAAENALLAQRLAGVPVFPSFLDRRGAAVGDAPPPLPDDVVSWFRNLSLFQGVPFNYLVPDERALPPESIRFFYVDQNWLDALIDGAFSIGRAAVSGQSLEARHAPMARRLAPAPVSGFLLRSQAVAGWPNLRASGYRDTGATDPIGAVRITRLSSDTMLCLFDDVVASMYLREPPEQLRHGVERGSSGGYSTTLRSVTGGPGPVAPGQQYQASTGIPMRPDGRTIDVSTAATAVKTRLSTDFAQTFPQGFTAAEFALELTMGVVEVEFTR